MANSNQSVVSDGSLTYLDLSIDYLDRPTIHVYFDGTEVFEGVEWQWSGSVEKRIEFINAPIDAGVEILVQRISDISEVRHEYTLGAAFTPQTLDENFKQILFIAQEARESNLSSDFFDHINMHGNRIRNLGLAEEPDDAVPLTQFQPLFDAAFVESSANAALAEAWATQTSAPVEGGLFGAKYYAELASEALDNTIQTNVENHYTAKQFFDTGANFANLTPSRAVTIDGFGNIATVNVTSTEQGTLAGVTSNIQSQLNGKVPTTRTISAGLGLGGGGVLSSDVSLAVALTELPAVAAGVMSSPRVVVTDGTSPGTEGRMTITDIATDGGLALTSNVVTRDHGATAIGSFRLLAHDTVNVVSGNTLSGAALSTLVLSVNLSTGNLEATLGSANTGSWRALNNGTFVTGATGKRGAALFQRIA